MVDDDVEREAPPVVVAAVTAGSVPVPFLAVYAVIFIVHGRFHPVVPPDVTSTQGGEFAVGLVALALFAISFVALIMMLNGSRRWPFVLVQLAVLAGSIDLIVDSTRGGGVVGFVLAAAAVAAIVLALLPASWAYVRRPRRRNWPGRRRRSGRSAPAETDADAVAPATPNPPAS